VQLLPRKLAPRTAAVLAVVAVAMGAPLLAYALDAWPRLENDTVDARFSLRGHVPPPRDVAVVAIDANTFSMLRRQWPFPRGLHARAIEQLRADGASAIAYDVQFTEPSNSEHEDLALYSAVASAGNVVLATTEVDSNGDTAVLGGAENLAAAHAVAAASNLPTDPGGVVRRYPYAELGLPSFAVAAARVAGHHVPASRFPAGGALIDFRGPPGSVPTYSFSDVLAGRVPARDLAGRIVVVGASAPTLQDVHPTSTTGTQPMSGAEIQADAIWTALHGNPLRPASPLLALLAIVLLGAVAPLASLRIRVLGAGAVAVLAAGAYLVACQLAFDSGSVLSVSYPLAAWTLGVVGMVAANYLGALVERNSFARQLGESQLELIRRLAQAIESRDAETGEHIRRIGLLCEQLALRVGWNARDAEMLRHASVMHDIGKIGLPDSVLLKPGRLDPAEWDVIKSHTTAGAAILAGSTNPIVRMAERIALTHHERWDGSGYPYGLRGEEIPLEGRICAVVDVYDALLSQRVYKGAWKPEEVVAELRRGRASDFDPALVDAFLAMIPELSPDLAPFATRSPVPKPAPSVSPA
jgi:HD-GYP domain-containing protein (c-di-GMP phosphodiesterase class II)